MSRARTRRRREAAAAARNPSPGARGGWLLVVGVAAIVLAAVAAIALRGGEATPAPTSPAGPASTASLPVGGTPVGDLVTGTPLPPLGQGADPAVGSPIPAVDGRAYDGTPISFGSGNGRPMVILFLTHWCGHCQAEVPRVQAWLDANGQPAGVDLYAVSTATDSSLPNFPPDSWLEREGWTVPTVVDDTQSSIAQAYGLSGFPFWTFVDGDGRVSLRAAGELTIEQLEAILARLTG